MGAVLGSKAVKAIVVSGTQKMRLADQAALNSLYKSTYSGMLTGTKALSTFGTAVLVNPINTMGALGTKNLATEVFEPAEAIRPERSWPSAIGASTRPMAKGGSGTFAHSRKKPTRPNASITQTSKMRLFTAKAPTMQATRMNGKM